MPLKAVVFDWAGTIIDFGSRAPMGVFVEAFATFGVTLTVAEARGPMGKPKRDHIADLLALPRVAAAWKAAHGHNPSDADIDRLYEVFVPMNGSVV
jgi:phosphonoacetaldehyde hydrolase